MLRVTHPESDTEIFEYLDQNTNLERFDYKEKLNSFKMRAKLASKAYNLIRG